MVAIKRDKSVIIIFVGLLVFVALYWYTYNNRQCSETIVMVSENLETEKDDIEEYDISQEENVKVLKKINLNTSSMEELSDLIYVSDEQAELIVDYRNEHGDFKNVDDVQYVEGITGTTVNIIEDYTYVA
ncbi:hypothetical protein SDC9_142092 [bioreactor metagenome]|uniref:ComE operon protein 1 n=1 Tax=bioreactor metagenome TaxID=1076179 RepID=A0A645E290_9ZZZZ